MPRNTVYLLDMLNAAHRALDHVSGFDQAAFEQDALRQDAVFHCLVIIGEATRRISEDFRTAHPEITWHGMQGLRNRLVHEYDEVNLAIVWNVLQTHLPALIELITPLVPSESESDQDQENHENQETSD
ncbi:MAG: DUF86 domain-containing protein [Anaerolineae bacterium]|nr:DUF86 domain-containing protein [Anaerolineae bacterium]